MKNPPLLNGYKKQTKQVTSKQERMIKEKLSLKVKLIASHILIAIVPILIIVITLTMQASSSLLKKVNSSNLAYVSKVLDGNIIGVVVI